MEEIYSPYQSRRIVGAPYGRVRGLIHGMAEARHGAEYGASGIPPRLRFGTFEVNLEARELRNRGIRIKLPRKPFQVLELLLKKSGLLVRREELIQQLWLICMLTSKAG